MSLAKQWRDHMNDGAIVQWLRRLWWRIQQRVFIRSYYVVSIGTRIHGLPGGPVRLYLSRGVAPEIETAFDVPLLVPIALKNTHDVVVVLEDVHFRRYPKP